MNVTRGVVLVAIGASLALGGCTKVEALNKGGDTPCNEYIGQSSDEQKVTVTKYLKSTDQYKNPTDDQVTSSMSAVDLLCRIQKNAKTPIKNADLTGIFVPRPS